MNNQQPIKQIELDIQENDPNNFPEWLEDLEFITIMRAINQ